MNIPDLFAVRNGEVIFIEVKRAGAKARPLQEYRIRQIQQQGIKAIVVHSVEELITNYQHSGNSRKEKITIINKEK